MSPLFLAVNSNMIDTVEWLIARKDVEGKELAGLPKYDLEECTVDGRTPLWQAAFKGYREVCERLVAAGANILRLTNPANNMVMGRKQFKADDVAVLLPHMDRVKIVTIGGGRDLHRLLVGDEVEGKYRSGSKVSEREGGVLFSWWWFCF